MGDNQIFNVNGIGHDFLVQALELVFKQDGSNTTAKSWSYDQKYGLIFYWHKAEKAHVLPAPLDAPQCAALVSSWLKSEEASQVIQDGWDRDADHDGSNELGFRVFVEDWGHVNGSPYAICAVKPAFIWYGK